MALSSFLMVLVAPLVGRAEAPFAEGLKAHLGKLTKDELPGIAVLVARDGKIVFQSGFGFADLESKTPVTAETKFRIGSVTKQFTAAAILRLADDGKLKLSDPLEQFFPGFPGGSQITLHHLLTHTSGLHSYTGKPEFMARVPKPITPAELIAWFREDKPDFAPGAGFLYNNSGYFLAGEIAAKVAGKTFEAFLREAFFEPLGMKDTGIFVNSRPPAGIALGYSVADGKATRALDWDMAWAGGAGALYATIGDLFRWNEALFGGRVLREESLKLMTTPVKLPANVDGMSYGYGVAVAKVNGLPSINHAGGLNGWSSELIRLPEQGCTVVALGNAMPPVPSHEPSGVTRMIIGNFLKAEIQAVRPPSENLTLEKTNYADFIGRYAYPSAVLTVSVEGQRLFAQLTAQPKFEVFASAPDEFFWKVTDARVQFVRNEKAVVIAAKHTQNGTTFTAPRITEPAEKISSTEIEAIVGEYRYAPGAVLTVTREGESVFAQLTGQPKHPIFPKSATEYEWRVVEANVKFSKGKDGQVTKAVHTQNGATFDAPRIK